MPLLKNPRHERFCREFVKTGVGAEAYRRAYPRVNPRETAKRNASRLRTYAHVNQRISELRQSLAKRGDITEDKILTDYQFAIDQAKAQDKLDLIINAATAQARLVGLLRDRTEVGKPGDFDQLESVDEVLEEVAERAGPETASALAKAMRLDQDPRAIDAGSRALSEIDGLKLSGSASSAPRYCPN